MPLDSDTLDRVKQLFVVTMPQELGKGRDAQKYGRSYQNLEVTCAWRLEYPSQWLKYAAERNSVNMNMQQLRRQAIPLQTWTSKLEEASKNMPGTLHAEVGERFLLHGTNPARILDILHQSFSDKLASLNGMFGAGSYVAEDPEKIDQYTTPDPGFEVPGLEELHSRLYRAGGNAHPGEDTFYCFLVRAVCGACQVVEGLDKDRLRDADSGTEVFLTPDRRVLSHIPHASPSLSYHTLVVNVAKHKVPAGVYRFREVVLFDGNRIYPEYLLAYRRI
ncbi:TNKS2 [Symbiodinium sp. CCMP2456]|nr:TNKS2 [Symbiodinium sp. CCMP2456]